MKLTLSVLILAAVKTQGFDAKGGKYPYQASIRSGVGDDSHICSGSILNERWILTAAKCINPKRGDSSSHLKVVVGSNSLNEYQGQLYQVLLVERHEKFNEKTLENNIGLLFVTRDIIFHEKVNRIPIFQGDPLSIKNPLISTGWNNVKNNNVHLQEASTRIISQNECFKLWGSKMQSSNICTSPISVGKMTCAGEYGSPLVKRDEKTDHQLIGILSLCDNVSPNIFVNVRAYYGWIKQKMDSHASMNPGKEKHQ